MVTFPNFPYISKELYFMGFKATTFAALVLSLIGVFIITISIHLILTLFVFVPFLAFVSFIGGKIKKEQSKGHDKYVKSLFVQFGLPDHISNNYQINHLMILRKNEGAL